MTDRDQIFLTHILEAIEHIQDFTKGQTKSSFLDSEMMQAAVIQKLEIIGEATKNVRVSIRRKYPKVPWIDMAGMRDKLIHHYFGVDLKIVWNVVKKELPPLKKTIKGIIEAES